ncbi:hypothetical protein [Duganella sp. BuS-21]|uniref:hypothetical protein n=1 Tax=Duganella sp. BuS-21 TaxID=2943848 RepID=UPI0035A68FFA
MTQRLPHQALSFTARAAKLAAQYGLKQGIKKAAARVNPALLVLDTAASVLDAANSWLKLRAARTRLNGLASVIEEDESRLAIERTKLKEELAIAREQLGQDKQIRERIGKLTLLCAKTVQALMQEMATLRKSDLPDVGSFEKLSGEMQGSWDRMREALDYYNRTTL